MSKSILKKKVLKDYDFIDAATTKLSTNTEHVTEVPLEKIQADFKNNLREDYRDIENLAQSIEEQHLLQPITVYVDAGKYIPIYGFRRLKAFQMLNERHQGNGYGKIRCIVKKKEDVDFNSIEEQMIVENVQRNSLNPMEVRKGLEILRTKGYSNPEIAKKIGKAVGYIEQIFCTIKVMNENKEIEQVVNSYVNIGMTDVSEIRGLPSNTQVELLKAKGEGEIKTTGELRKVVKMKKAELRGEPVQSNGADGEHTYHSHIAGSDEPPVTTFEPFHKIEGDILKVYPFFYNKITASSDKKDATINALEEILAFVRGE